MESRNPIQVRGHKCLMFNSSSPWSNFVSVGALALKEGHILSVPPPPHGTALCSTRRQQCQEHLENTHVKRRWQWAREEMPQPVSRAPTGLEVQGSERGLRVRLALLQPSLPVEGLVWLGLQGGCLETSG